MKTPFPIKPNKQFKQIVAKITKLNNNKSPVNHKQIIRHNNLNTKKYFDQFSKLMN